MDRNSDFDSDFSSKRGEESEDSRIMIGEERRARVELSRPVYPQTPLRIKNEKGRTNFSSFGHRCHSTASECCRLETISRAIVSFFPILSWLPVYKWRTDLVPDILAGLTVGIMSIPQGMAYARLAGMPPVYGLYTNIIPTFVYFLLGTTKHAAIGPATVLSLITSSIRYKHMPCQDCWLYPLNWTNESMGDDMPLPEGPSVLTPIDIGSAVAFLAGAFMVLMGLFRLSFIADYLPDQLVGGFTVAAAVQVFAGQLPSMFGVKLPNRNGIGKVIMNFIDLFSTITHVNVATFLIFLVCFLFLALSKRFINPKFQQLLRIPFPGEFIVMVAATLVSHFAKFHQIYDVSIVQHIAAGLPAPSIPKVSIMGMLAADSFVLAVVTYSYSISLAKLYAKRNGYKIQSTQEFYAYGFMNFIGSFFQCFNSGQSVARSLVYEMAGAKSQLCGMFGSLVVIITVLFIAPFLESLPNAALAAIIVTAVLEMLRNLRELPPLFKKSKYDFSIYFVTLVSVIVLDVTYGLAVSVIFALVTVLSQVQRSRVDLVTNETRYLCTSDDQAGKSKIDSLEEQVLWKRVLVLRPTAPIFYVNAEKVKNHLIEKTLEPATDRTEATIGMPAEKQPLAAPEKAKYTPPAILVLDMASVAFMDLMGVNALKDLLRRLSEKNTELYLCGCTDSVTSLMESSGFLESAEMVLFPTVLDAVAFARFRLSGDWLLVKKLDENQKE